ncbi:Multidrug and toxin extrusion protein 1 [Taenia crassiceps]|uniref:Multidrug and toxin extrusion protein n=1 Tax=Taenia crassiceps TaxID=6207 RepID=A0ABR4QQQ8_9CEST
MHMPSISRSYFEELRNLITLACPLMLTQFLRFICPFLSIMICGHFSREELDAASLASTVINVLGLCIDMGFSTASETLFSQTFGSSKRKLMGIILQRALVIMTLLFITLACIHVNIEGLLLMARQDPLISSLAAEYILFFLPGLYCDFLFMTLSRYLTSQNLVRPMMLAASAGTIFTVLTQPAVYRLGLGLRASACFLSLSFAVMLSCEVLYIFVYRIYSETWAGWDFAAAMSEWGIFFKLGIPGILMIGFEEWCLELSTFIAGTISDAVLGAQAIVFQIQSFIYMVPLGICTAVNVRVGQGLGAFDPQRAKHTYTTALLSVFGIVITTAVPIVLLRNKIPYLFTTDKEVVEEAEKLFPMLLIFQFCEGLGGVSEAVLLACGRQFLGAITIFLGYYVVGLPLGLLLTYKFEIGIIGMWVGLATGFFLTDCVYTFTALRTDWKEQSRRALCNVRQNSEGITNGCGEALPHEPNHSGFVSMKLEMSVDEKQSPLTTHRSDYTHIRLRIAIFAAISVFLFCNLCVVWCTTFWTNDWQIQLKDFTDGIFLNQVFCEIAEYDWTAVEPLLSNASAFTRLRNWKMLVKNLEEFFIEELQHLVVIAPPSIFHIIFSPSSCAAKTELERVTLLLLLAAIKCKRRELYIRDIMNNLSTETQKGIMQSITSLTEYSDTTISLTGAYELPSGLRYSIRKALSSRVELYFLLVEEVLRRICDHSPDWTPTKRTIFSPQQETRQEKDFSVKISRSRSLTSSLDLVGLAFKRSSLMRCDMLKSPQSIETDTATTSETGYESRPPTDKHPRDRQGLEGKRDLNSVLGIVEARIVNGGNEKVEDAQITKAKAKLRQQSLVISEQADQLEEVQSQLAEMRAEVDRLRTERARLADAAAAARHWRDEADAGQQAIVQLRESERTCEKLKQRLEAAQYYRVRCQELSKEVETLVKARDALENRLSEQRGEQFKIHLLDQRLIEQSQRIMELESQREKDLEEICRLKNEVTESRIDALSVSRMDLTTRGVSPSPSDCEKSDLLSRLPSLQIETSAADSVAVHPSRSEASQTHEVYDRNALRIQKELELTVERCASQLQRIRTKLNSGYGREDTDRQLGAITAFDNVEINLGESAEALIKDLEQTILDIIEAVEENDKKLIDMEKSRLSKPMTFPVTVQTDLILPQTDARMFEQSSASLKAAMLSAQSTFQDSVESLHNIITDAMHRELKSTLDRIKDQDGRPDANLVVKSTQTYAFPSKDAQCQMSPENQLSLISNTVQRPYRICNRFGTPLQLSVVQPCKIQRSASISSREQGNGSKVVNCKGVGTLPIGSQMQLGVNEAVREALLQASEAKTRIAVLCREKDEVNELLRSTEHELEQCKEFLKEYETRNTYLEKENRALLLQLKSLLSQNQGVATEALENSEYHYREQLALRDELELMKHHKERLEEKPIEQYKTLSSPKKAKPATSFLQKACDALLKTKDVYTLDNSRLPSTDSYEQGTKHILSPSISRCGRTKDDDEYVRDFQRFIDHLERPQLSPHSDNSQKALKDWGSSIPVSRCMSEYQPRTVLNSSSTDSEHTDNSMVSLVLKSSPHFPVTDRSEDRIEAYSVSSIVPPNKKAFMNRTNPLSFFSKPSVKTADVRPLGDGNPKETQSVCIHRRRVAYANENSTAPCLGGLIGRGRVSVVDPDYLSPITSFSQQHSDTVKQSHHESSEVASNDRKSPTTPVHTTKSPDCLAKPVVFLEYGDL